MGEIEIILAGFRTVLSDRGAVYVSSPLTTGRRLLAWRASRDRAFSDSEAKRRGELARYVVEPNRQEVGALVAGLRRRRLIVIDPTALPDLPGWTQSDYRVFWGLVVERYSGTVVFANDWQYSNGCAYEYLVAVRIGARIIDAAERPIDPAAGLALLADAVREMDEHDAPADFLRAVISELEKLARR